MGYDNQHWGYKLYFSSYKLVFILRDVKFNELPKETASYKNLDDDVDSFITPK